MGRFSNGDILERSKKFAVQAINLTRMISADRISQHLAVQLLRSATSIGANLCEADMSDTAKDFCSKINIAQKEAAESVYWIGLIRQAKILSASELEQIEKEAIKLTKICRQIIFSTKAELH